MQRPITAVFVLGLLVGSAWADAKAWDLDSFPDPKRDVNLCGRKGKKSNICDPDGVLSYSGANRVEGLIKDIWNGVHPYALAPCGDKGDEGFQVSWPATGRSLLGFHTPHLPHPASDCLP